MSSRAAGQGALHRCHEPGAVIWEAHFEGGDVMAGVCVCMLQSGGGCCAARKRRKSRRKRIFGQAAACIPPPAPSLLSPSFPGTSRDFSLSWQVQQRHLTARGRILHSTSYSGVRTRLSILISGFGWRKATLVSSARRHTGLPSQARSRLPARRSGAAGGCGCCARRGRGGPANPPLPSRCFCLHIHYWSSF